MKRVEVSILFTLGARTRHYGKEVLQTFAVLGAVLALAVQPWQWRRTVRTVFKRQLLFTALGAAHFTCILAALAGVLVVVQTGLWLGKVGLSQMAGPLLVVILVRELGPLLGNLVVIVNSGSAIATELGLMSVHGEVRVLEAQGLDPLPYLIMPRVLAASMATLCLTVLFIAVAFVSGFVFGSLQGEIQVDAGTFATSFLEALQPADVVNVALKGTLPGLLTGVICATSGLTVGPSSTQVPRACRRALVRSLAALFLVSAVSSVLTYV